MTAPDRVRPRRLIIGPGPARALADPSHRRHVSTMAMIRAARVLRASSASAGRPRVVMPATVRVEAGLPAQGSVAPYLEQLAMETPLLSEAQVAEAAALVGALDVSPGHAHIGVELKTGDVVLDAQPNEIRRLLDHLGVEGVHIIAA